MAGLFPTDDPAALASAAIVATAGAWWFAYVLKGLKSLRGNERLAVYGAIWLAYFAVTMALIGVSRG
ncbi:MAG: hypothetical protein ACFB00_12710 [Parvularculaceae bacterium]